MSRRDAGAAGQQARHARARLQAALGEAPPGLLEDGAGTVGFECQGAGNSRGATPAEGSEGEAGRAPSLRWRVGLRVAVLLAALAAVAGVWFWWQAGAAAPEVLPLSGVSSGENRGDTPDAIADGTPEPAAGRGAPQGESSPAGLVVVHVAGAVGSPGVLRLQQGSRVDDAITAAGGPTADGDANRLNLALVLEDGQKIYVPRRGEAMPAATDADIPGGAATDSSGSNSTGSNNTGSNNTGQQGAAAGKVNLNTADAAELDTLPKVGPVLAQRIVDWRKEHGPFRSVEELDGVDGVGPKMLEALLPLVTV